MQEITRNKYDELWCLLDGAYSIEKAKHFEGLLTQGNGYMDVRASFDEGIKSVDQAEEYERKPANVTLEKGKVTPSKWGTYIPGIVGRHPHLLTEIINLPYFFEIVFFAGDERLSMEDSNISEHVRYLDMRDGSLNREFVWKTDSGLTLKMEYVRFLSYVNRHTAISQVKVSVLSGEGDVSFASGINAGVRTNGFNHFEKVQLDDCKNRVSATVLTNGGSTVLMTSELLVDADVTVTGIKDDKRVASLGKKYVKTGDSFIIQKLVAVATDFDREDGELLERNRRYLDELLSSGAKSIFDSHREIWAKKWEESDIIIEGDDRTQKALRMSIYHLLRSNNDEDDRVAICAKGYAGEAYFGRYFWDTEINMLPFYIYTNPEAAKKLLMFRYNTLEGAKRNARAYGYPGARYPWESSITGDEECANWQYCDHEVHVTADIIYAVMHYVKATGDVDFIKDYAIDIMVETSRYWCKRVDKNADGSFSLLGVMGPDEYLPITSNNRYTNKMVRFALETTLDCLKDIQFKDKKAYELIEGRLSLSQEDLDEFKSVAEGIIVGYDSSDDVVLQCDEFMSYADLDFDSIWKDRSRCFGEFISQEKNYRSKALKQADVLEMFMLFRHEFSLEKLRNNYDYYEPITTHDSSLSAAVHGILCAWMDREEEALAFLDKVIDIDMSDSKLGAKEGIHIANCGGLWQLVVFGFAGMRSAMDSDELVFEPHLPKHWKSLSIPIKFRGKVERIVF